MIRANLELLLGKSKECMRRDLYDLGCTEGFYCKTTGSV